MSNNGPSYTFTFPSGREGRLIYDDGLGEYWIYLDEQWCRLETTFGITSQQESTLVRNPNGDLYPRTYYNEIKKEANKRKDKESSPDLKKKPLPTPTITRRIII